MGRWWGCWRGGLYCVVWWVRPVVIHMRFGGVLLARMLESLLPGPGRGGVGVDLHDQIPWLHCQIVWFIVSLSHGMAWHGI